MQKIHLFSSAAINYLPKVKVLFESVRRWHPEWVLHLVLAETDQAVGELEKDELIDEVHSVPSLDIPDWEAWAFCHDVVELCTAIKPFMLAKLLAREDCAGVVFLDPDTAVFSRLDDIVDALAGASVVLTPHQTLPDQTLEAVMDNEICCLRNGVYNLGFFAVAPSNEGRRFAAWWADRLYHFCRNDTGRGLFTDQRWIDLVPALFDDVTIMRSSRHNVAPWNLTNRELVEDASRGFLIDGEALGFYHFTGFDNDAHLVMAYKHTRDNADVKKLVRWYAAQVAKYATSVASQPWSLGVFDNGQAVTRVQRIVFRERTDLQKLWLYPLSTTDVNCFLGWWRDQGAAVYEAMNPDQAWLAFPALTAGYRWRFEGGQLATAMHRLKVGLLSASTARYYTRRGFAVLKTAGVRGLLRKLSR